MNGYETARPSAAEALLLTGVHFGLPLIAFFGLFVPVTITAFITENETVQTAVTLIFYLLFSNSLYFYVFYRQGYKRNAAYREGLFKSFIINLSVSYLFYYLLGYILQVFKSFNILYTETAPVQYFLGIFIESAKTANLKNIMREHFGTYNLIMLFTYIPVLVPSALGFRHGMKKRENLRNEFANNT